VRVVQASNQSVTCGPQYSDICIDIPPPSIACAPCAAGVASPRCSSSSSSASEKLNASSGRARRCQPRAAGAASTVLYRRVQRR
jgi:hypothetical protein